ncbi:MAG: redox-regulated ATPase YchF [Candidatus Portnoybacteria bacterium CG09_land_8_20_14_0_10_44_13]|uniref:Ribosome-binding ATPase YchF n=1 Tax=Candidatus Portnoybacteria bacterium CG09_land_8_20_14_0_10_44_13 TaxID=1974811 RepID=A0A2H0WVN4_9BACT|nr:MAG: redox-regulated ATPase YchF [Candidatus Portnoybacteria bacterium CG09_land_8_20_14_0_10_44_13]
MKSSLSIGIVGLPNVGKSTLFRAITKKQVDCANYPFCTIEPNVGVVGVPDERVDKLVELTKSAKKVYATVEFVDIAGLVEGAHKGEGLGNQFLSHIREVDAIVYILRNFENPNIVNVNQTIDPWRDKEILDTELILKDIETADKIVGRLQKDSKSGDKEIIKELEVMAKIKENLDAGAVLSEQDFDEKTLKILKPYQLLAMKPRLYLLNGESGGDGERLSPEENRSPNILILDILSESEAENLTSEEREELGLSKESQLDVLIKKCYELLGLITFLTTGPDETRAWTIQRGTKAPQAGGVIHTDFENTFVKAEVVNWKDLLDAGGFPKAKERGLIRTEGKEYVVQDGDVIEIKHG